MLGLKFEPIWGQNFRAYTYLLSIYVLLIDNFFTYDHQPLKINVRSDNGHWIWKHDNLNSFASSNNCLHLLYDKVKLKLTTCGIKALCRNHYLDQWANPLVVAFVVDLWCCCCCWCCFLRIKYAVIEKTTPKFFVAAPVVVICVGAVAVAVAAALIVE